MTGDDVAVYKMMLMMIIQKRLESEGVVLNITQEEDEDDGTQVKPIPRSINQSVSRWLTLP